MNTTADSGGFLGSNNISGFGYGIALSIGILLLITTILLTSYFCTRQQTTVPPRRRSAVSSELEGGGGQREVVVEVGIDTETLKSYPKLLYSEANVKETERTGTCCAICLADYKNSDVLRLLPECGHLFHVKCVDQWLGSHPTCPVCRTSPLTTPLSTPLAEVVPLAMRRD